MVLIGIGLVVAAVVWAKRGTLLAPLGRWLQHHHITLAHAGLVTIPHLGGLDAPRLLLIAAAAAVASALGVLGRRRTIQRRKAAAEPQE